MRLVAAFGVLVGLVRDDRDGAGDVHGPALVSFHRHRSLLQAHTYSYARRRLKSPMLSFGRGGARSGSMIGRRNLPGTGRGLRGSLLRTRVGRAASGLGLREGPRDRARPVLRERHDGPVALRGRRRDDDAPQPIVGLVRHVDAQARGRNPHDDVARRPALGGWH